jgi:hypothetical protein
MIAQSYIRGNLAAINRRYLTASSQLESLLYSKLAILELCGWIEESMDDIVLRCAMRLLKDPDNRHYCQVNIVRRTYGFDYQENFRFMLIRLVGLAAVEKVEARVDSAKLSLMESALSTLKSQRNTEAHTHVKGTTRTINAPSVTMSQFVPLYEGLMEFDRVLRLNKW